jgi:hypothetical protein
MGGCGSSKARFHGPDPAGGCILLGLGIGLALAQEVTLCTDYDLTPPLDSSAIPTHARAPSELPLLRGFA